MLRLSAVVAGLAILVILVASALVGYTPTTDGVALEPVVATTPGKNVSASSLLKRAITTVFWVGEKADDSNGYIANDESAWDGSWQTHYGGFDDPDNRCGYYPCQFTPKENPFYLALPYNAEDPAPLKNHWVEVESDHAVCYGQWEDVGPFIEDDYDYVFGNSTVPKNTMGVDAGLDISPALRDCLGVGDVSITYWRFVDEQEVPEGPWREIITIRSASW